MSNTDDPIIRLPDHIELLPEDAAQLREAYEAIQRAFRHEKEVQRQVLNRITKEFGIAKGAICEKDGYKFQFLVANIEELRFVPGYHMLLAGTMVKKNGQVGSRLFHASVPLKEPKP